MQSRVELRLENRVATVLGATGLTGRHLVQTLLDDEGYSEVHVFARSRRSVPIDPKLHFHAFPALAEEFADTRGLEPPAAMVERLVAVLPKGDHFYSCLGTTRSVAGSAEAFRFVDYTSNLAFARAAVARGYSSYLLVSAVNANPRSMWLYPRTKGELELAISVLPFWGIHIFQPGLLVGERSSERLGERLAGGVLQGLRAVGFSDTAGYQAIAARTVAAAMVRAARETKPGTRAYGNAAMATLARVGD